jgi:hypothetical protein
VEGTVHARMTLILDPSKLAPLSFALIERTRNMCGDHACPISSTMLREKDFYIGSQSRKGNTLLAKLSTLSAEAQKVMIERLILIWQRSGAASSSGPSVVDHFVPANKDFAGMRERVSIMYNLCHGGFMEAAGLAAGCGADFWTAFQGEPPHDSPLSSQVDAFVSTAATKFADVCSKARAQ